MNKINIKEVWLFTNRNVIVFDENGEQINNLQAALGGSPKASWEDYIVKDGLTEVIKAKPKIYLAQWQNWRHEITLDEFCSLLGFGEWYWQEKKNKLETKPIFNKQEYVTETAEPIAVAPQLDCADDSDYPL